MKKFVFFFFCFFFFLFQISRYRWTQSDGWVVLEGPRYVYKWWTDPISTICLWPYKNTCQPSWHVTEISDHKFWQSKCIKPCPLSLSLSLSLLKQFSTDTQCCIREKNTLILVIFTPALHSPTPLPSTHTHLPTEEGGWVTYFTYIGCCSSHWHQHWHDTFLSWQYLLNQ